MIGGVILEGWVRVVGSGVVDKMMMGRVEVDSAISLVVNLEVAEGGFGENQDIVMGIFEEDLGVELYVDMHVIVPYMPVRQRWRARVGDMMEVCLSFTWSGRSG